MTAKHLLFLSFFCFFVSARTMGQNLVLPQVSQRAEVIQRLGYTDIDIVYSSPNVNGRKIWNDLVPYGEVWRAGANDNTTISFTDDVTINGQSLAAGTYGLHMIPTASEWTIIFSKNHTSWGSFFYRKEEDALRVTTKPEACEMHESLDYTFMDRAASSCKVALSWERLRVPFTVAVDAKNITLRHIREQLRNQPGFGWHGWEEAAHYCIENKFNYEEGLRWANNSIRMEENYTNLAAKAQLQKLMGNSKEADETKKKVLELVGQASEAGANLFAYELMNEDDMPTALEVFKMNVKKHPDSWNAYDSMGEAYGRAGDKKLALTNYKTALAKAPAEQQERIKRIIAGMQ